MTWRWAAIALRIAAALALLALLCVSLVPAFGPWPGDMIAPFRLQLALAALLGLLAAMALRDLRLVGLAGIVVAATLAPIAVRLLDRPVLPATAPGQPVSLVVANVLADNRQYDRVVALVREQRSDIFAAVETTPEWVAALAGLKDQYPHSFAPTTLGVFGVALYAKRPFSPRLLRIGRRQLPLLRADFGDMVVYVAHPMPPATARTHRRQSRLHRGPGGRGRCRNASCRCRRGPEHHPVVEQHRAAASPPHAMAGKLGTGFHLAGYQALDGHPDRPDPDPRHAGRQLSNAG